MKIGFLLLAVLVAFCNGCSEESAIEKAVEAAVYDHFNGKVNCIYCIKTEDGRATLQQHAIESISASRTPSNDFWEAEIKFTCPRVPRSEKIVVIFKDGKLVRCGTKHDLHDAMKFMQTK